MTRSRTVLVATALSVVMVLALVLAGCASPNSSQSNQNPQSSTEASSGGTSGETSMGTTPETSSTVTTPSEPPTITTPPSTTTTGTTGGTGTGSGKTWMMKQQVKIGDWTIWVQSRSFMRAVAGVKAPAGKQLVEIKLWVKNRGKKTNSLTPSEFQLMDSNGNTLTMAKAKGTNFLAGSSKKSLKAGTRKMYRLVFEVPRSEKNLKLTFQPSDVTGSTTEVTIQLKPSTGAGTKSGSSDSDEQ